MRKIILGVVATLVVLFAIKYYLDRSDDKTILKENTALIQQQIKNVGKLVVTEGHFSEAFTYKDSKTILKDWFASEKKAVVIANADVSIAYDLSLIEFKVDEANKTLQIISIPKEEIKINPNLEYYDVQSDYLNPFKAEDYNKIKDSVHSILMKKIEASTLKSNAQNRLISELSKFYILTNSMGWTLQYQEQPIQHISVLETLDLKP